MAQSTGYGPGRLFETQLRPLWLCDQGKFLNFSGPWFLHPYNTDSNTRTKQISGL